MILATDTHYGKHVIRVAGVLFQGWDDKEAASVHIDERLASAAPYQPGMFYLRELPHILSLLSKLPSPPSMIIVDGYVYLDEVDRKGLGAHLFEALNETTPIIGVAKKSFAGSPHAIAVQRGASKRPLFVTAAGISPDDAAQNILNMDGPHRIPTLLKFADRLCREG